MTRPRILVGGIGNIFLGDDAFGSEVARRLAGRGQPEGVRVVDFGIRGLDLAYALLDGGYEAVVLVDVCSRGEPPGTLSVLELPVVEPIGSGEGPMVEGHNLDPARVLHMAASLGASVGRVLLVGCEPKPFDESDDFGAELSPDARAAVDQAVPLIESLVSRLLRGEEIAAASDEDESITIPERRSQRGEHDPEAR
jgi:hydrogenase maturation protease